MGEPETEAAPGAGASTAPLPVSRLVRLWWSLVRIGGVSFLVVMAMLYFFHRKMIYVPTQGAVSKQDFQE